MFRTALALAAALLVGAPAAAFAQQADRQYEVVPYGDLNLDNDAGADALIGRIQHASSDVCNDRTGRRPLHETRVVHACRYVAENDAVRDVDHPNVYRRYYGVQPEVIIGDEDESGYPDDYAYPQKG